jgi:hypothetical protein
MRNLVLLSHVALTGGLMFLCYKPDFQTVRNVRSSPYAMGNRLGYTGRNIPTCATPLGTVAQYETVPPENVKC